MKKTVFLILIFSLLTGGFFYWWQDQTEERVLNRTLPTGVRVNKCLLTGEWQVINKIDRYKFKIPREWKGIKEIEYIPEREEKGYIGSSLSIKGNKGIGNVIGIDQFKSGGNMNLSLDLWAESNFNTFGLIGNFSKDQIGEFEIVKTQENIHFAGEYVYFFKKDKTIYVITSPSEEFIRYIIANGKW